MTARERKAIRIGAVVVLAAIALKAGPALIQAVATAREQLAARHELLQSYHAILSDTAVIADSVEKLGREVVTLAPDILSGDSESEAMAALTGQITHLATAHRLRLEAVIRAPDSARAGSLHRVTARAELQGDVRGIAGITEALRNSQPLVVPVRLEVLSPATPSIGAESLLVKLTLQGWFQEKDSDP